MEEVTVGKGGVRLQREEEETGRQREEKKSEVERERTGGRREV